jgi:hypothetical protein
MSNGDGWGGPAFPSGLVSIGDGDHQAFTSGMSLRDWFAGQPDIIGSTLLIGKEEGEALAGPRPEGGLDAFRWQCQVLAAMRYIAADAMLAERAKAEGGVL